MRTRVAMAVAVMSLAASGLAQNAAQKTFVNRAAVVQAAVSASGATAGFVPVFTDSAGDMQNSALFQVNNGNGTFNLGLGTTTPAFNMHFVSTVDPASVTVDGIGIVGVNFMGRRARGTLLAPSAIQADDNIMAMQGRGYGATGFSPTSRAFMKFFAAENWTDTAQGTYISLATTQQGAAATSERLRITGAGRVGIGTIAPGAMLEVNGGIKLSAGSGGSITFADGTSMSTAATGGGGGSVTITSPDNSLTVGGTASNPTLSANSAVLQKRVSGQCAAGSAMTTVTSTGAVVCGTIGAGGSLANVPQVVANTSFIGGPGLGSPNTIYTAAADGFYRVSVYMNVATAGSCSSAPCVGETITVQWSDGISTTALATANCNLVTPCGSAVTVPVWVKSGQSIKAYGQGYGSGTALSGGTFNAYVLVEQL